MSLGMGSRAIKIWLRRTFFNSLLSFIVLYSGTRDAKASNRLIDLSVLLLRLARLRSVTV